MTTRVGTKKMADTAKESVGRHIIFTYDENNIIMPLDAYEPGEIRETRIRLARELNCRPDEIKVRITGIRDGRVQKGSSLKIQLVDAESIRSFIK